MLDLIHEGGYSMYFILAVAGAALLLQARRAFAWFVSRDHSAASLARNTPTPLYLAAATMLASLGGTAAAFRAVFTFVLDGKHGADVVIMGSYEALAPLLLGSTLAFLIVLVHAVLAAALRAIQVKTPV